MSVRRRLRTAGGRCRGQVVVHADESRLGDADCWGVEEQAEVRRKAAASRVGVAVAIDQQEIRRHPEPRSSFWSVVSSRGERSQRWLRNDLMTLLEHLYERGLDNVERAFYYHSDATGLSLRSIANKNGVSMPAATLGGRGKGE